MALVICSECGQKVSDKAKVCPQCGAPIEVTVSDEFGTLHIEWEGKWMLADTSVDLYVNNQLVGKYSFKDGFSVDVPILSATTEITVKCGFRTAEHTFTFEPHQDYTLSLAYSRFTGGLGFETYDEDGNVTSDHLSTLMGIIVFLFPLIGMIYALYVKKDKPAVFPTAMIVAVCGFLLGMMFMLIAGGFPFYMTFFGSLGGGGIIGILFMIQFLCGVKIL